MLVILALRRQREDSLPSATAGYMRPCLKKHFKFEKFTTISTDTRYSDPCLQSKQLGSRDRRLTTNSKLASIYIASFRLVKSQTKTVSNRNQANIKGCYMTRS